MEPAEINLDGKRAIYQGDDYKGHLYLFDTDGITPLNLNGYTEPKSQVRNSREASGSLLAEIECDFDDDLTTGHVVLTIDRAVTSAMPDASSHQWDYEMIDPDDMKETWASGSATVSPQVTRA